MQLRAAGYRLVDLLRISVVSVCVTERCFFVQLTFNPLNTELNPICQ